ncbi:MAG TPA: HD domain-containing protein [Phycisphaerales bacterium]|nr:HD domain-containing protein [Phycisphaerales bacterium]
MSDPRVRQEIALRAAQLMYARHESEYFQAKRKAAKMVGGSDRARDLPSNAEVREHVQLLAQLKEGDRRKQKLRSMRLEALRILRLLSAWRPRLIGSVFTGHIREGSDIDVHVFCDSAELVAERLEREGMVCDVERKRVVKAGKERHFVHVHAEGGGFPIELSVYPIEKVNFPFISSITGKPIEKTDQRGLESLLREEEPGTDIEAELLALEQVIDPWLEFDALLRPLEQVKQNPVYHPEGDALYHSLQVFDLARGVRGYDEEFLLAALLHDVGKGIDRHDHVAAGVEAIQDLVTQRTLWLVAYHMEAHEYRAKTLPIKARRRLEESEHLEDLLLLSEIDQAGRRGGVVVPTVEEALGFIRGLAEEDA